jgi:hypothetical protein
VTYRDEQVTKKMASVFARNWIDGRIDKPIKPYMWSQMRSLMDQLADCCIEESLRRNECEDDLYHRLDQAYDIIRGAWYSAAPSYATTYLTPEQKEALEPEELQKIEVSQHRLWVRHDMKRAFSEGTRSDQYPAIDKDSLIAAIADYLAFPYLRLPFLDWIFLDMCISREMSAFGESLKEHWLPGKRDRYLGNMRYHKAEGNLKEMNKTDWKEKFSRLNLLFWLEVGFPIAVIWASFHWNWTRLGYWFLGIYVAIVLLFVFGKTIKLTSRRIRNRRGIVEPKIRAFRLWDEMYVVWRRLEGPIVNPTRVREAMVTSTAKGAVWDNAAWSIIDRVIANDAAVWVVQPARN